MIDLSADVGEGAVDEAELWPLIDTANVACGGHTGDDASMRIAARFAREHDVILGAHPSYPDRASFGRKPLDISHDALRASLIAQLESLRAIAPIHHAKPHGALYNGAHKDFALASVIVDALRAVDPSLALVAPDRSEMSNAARAAGTRVIREAFADRRYLPDGSLMPRTQPGSLLTVDESAAQAELLANEAVVIAADGSRVAIAFDTLCIHSDMEGALSRLRAIRARLGV